MEKAIPVILDTDIGIDIDDTWALGYLLCCPELDLKLVTTATGDPEYRARIAAKFLVGMGRETPVGIGLASDYEAQPQLGWVADYDLAGYGGQVHRDGVAALIDFVNQSPEPMTIICIGPLTNIAEAVKRCPDIASKARIISMAGSINKGLQGQPGKIAEYNVVQDIPAAQKVFAAGWPIRITPLDTCGLVTLNGARYQAVRQADTAVSRLIMENYALWDRFYENGKIEQASSVLFDTVAVHMAYSDDYLTMETLRLEIDDEGYMRETAAGKDVTCAVDWRDRDAFADLLVARYCS